MYNFFPSSSKKNCLSIVKLSTEKPSLSGAYIPSSSPSSKRIPL
jgi:hypothetical protein